MPDNYQSTMLYVWVNVFGGDFRRHYTLRHTQQTKFVFANNGLFDFRSQHIRFVVDAYERRGYKG